MSDKLEINSTTYTNTQKPNIGAKASIILSRLLPRKFVLQMFHPSVSVTFMEIRFNKFQKTASQDSCDKPFSK